MEIHSKAKEWLSEKEWSDIKQKLFSIDKRAVPKIIVSVLMLREGFDVNNICVIVPLRASTSTILLEQTIGRGLRLMWREPEYTELKNLASSYVNKIKERKNTLLFFGRIWKYKGLDTLIRAEPLISKEIPDVKIIIAGRGESMEKYKKMIINRYK